MDNEYKFMVVVHGEGGHTAEYEVRTGDAVSAITYAGNAYRQLVGLDMMVCEVRLVPTLIAELRDVMPTSDESVTVKEQADPPEPNYPEDFKQLYKTRQSRERILKEMARLYSENYGNAYIAAEFDLSMESVAMLYKIIMGGNASSTKGNDAELPGYTWAQQHGFSVEAWRLTLNAMSRAYAEPGIYLSNIRQWFNWPNEIIDEVGNYITEYND